MATATRKSSRATIVNHSLVGQAESFLQDLPEKPKQDLSLREAIGRLQDEIKAALAKGYNYEELAKLLSGQGINISPLTLKNYVPSGKRRATATKPRRTKKSEEAVPASEETPVASEAAVPAIAPEPDPAPTKARRGRTKAVAATPPVAVEPETPPQQRTTRARRAPAKTTTRTGTTRRRKSVGA